VHSRNDLDAVDATAELKSNWEATLDFFFGALLGAAYTGTSSPFVCARRCSQVSWRILQQLTLPNVTSTSLFFHHISWPSRHSGTQKSRTSLMVLLQVMRRYSLFFLMVKVYFDESLYDIYKPFVAPLISTVTDEILKPLAPLAPPRDTFAGYMRFLSPRRVRIW
jgi:hypothetical protein